MLDKMTNAFLCWKLPKSVCSDLCVTMPNYQHDRYGTSLMNVYEAKQMFREVVLPLISAPPAAPDAPAGEATGELQARVWCSPRIPTDGYIWHWAVDDFTAGECLEFGREKTEEDAKREANEAKESWTRIRAAMQSARPTAKKEGR